MRKIFILIIAALIISVQTIGQTRVRANQIQDGSLRPYDAGTFTGSTLTFDYYKKHYNYSVTADVALTLAGSGNTAYSYIQMTVTGDGSHVLSFPPTWTINGAFDPDKIQEIDFYYNGTYVFVDIKQTVIDIIIPILTTAEITGGTDALNLSFSAAVNIPTSGWTLTASGGAVTVTGVSNSGTATPTFTTSRNITAGEDMTISYDPSTGATTSLTGNEIATIVGQIVETGDEDIPDNSVLVGSAETYTTIQAGINAATAGQVVLVKDGTYRETPVGKDFVSVQNYPGDSPVVTGLNTVATSWTSHDLTGGKSIYKTTISLPITGFAQSLTGNTTLLANQIFKDGDMMHEARWPNVSTMADLMNISKMRHRSQTTGGVGFNYTSVADSGLPNSSSFSLTGGTLVCFGWFWPHTRTITAHSGTTISYSAISSNNSDGQRYRQYYYVIGKLGLLDAAKEWFYDGTTLYLWQTGGGSPTGVEYKARNWGFDLRGKHDITIKGLTFIGCEPATGDANTSNVTIDNIRATYTNHDVTYPDLFPGYGNAISGQYPSGTPEMGIKLLGSNNNFINSELQYAASAGLWLGPGGRAENNKFEDWSYDGAWGAPYSFWGDTDNVKFLRSTIARTGRSAVDMGYSYTGNSSIANLNIEVGYNDISGWGMLNIDLGAIYSWGWRNLTGSSYHHNWFHDDGVVPDPTGRKLDGGQRAVYFDQGSGPVTVHHNVFWNNFDASSPSNMQDTQDIYSQMEFTGSPPTSFYRSSGGQLFYNNTIVSTLAHHSYATYEHGAVKDVFRNNIFGKIINLNWTGGAVGGYTPNEQYNLFDVEITNNSITVGTGTLKNQDFTSNFFLGTGSGGLVYRPHASSTSTIRDQGVVIAGITDDDDSNPDKGAYKFADNADPWIPGYNAVTGDEDILLENNNATFTTYHLTGGTTFSPTSTSNSVYSGGTASFFNTDEAYIQVDMTGTNFEWYAEQYVHGAIVEVQVDGVRQDCDSGTGGTQDCDLYLNTTTNNSTLIFSKTGMSAGAHTLTFINKSANVSSTGQFLTHDVVKVAP